MQVSKFVSYFIGNIVLVNKLVSYVVRPSVSQSVSQLLNKRKLMQLQQLCDPSSIFPPRTLELRVRIQFGACTYIRTFLTYCPVWMTGCMGQIKEQKD